MQLDGISRNLGNGNPMPQGTGQVQKNPGQTSSSDLDKTKKVTSRENSGSVKRDRKFDENALKDEVIEAIEQANDEFVTYDRKFEFSIHEDTKKITVKVLDSVTDEVIREIPPEKILDMVAGIWEVAGILVDEKI